MEGETVVAEAPHLIETKLLPGRARPELLNRQRLLDELDRLESAVLTLVDAPVGFGKTVLVESWCARTTGAVAWVSLDSNDDDPTRLWTYIAASVERLRPGLGRPALVRLRSPGAPTEAAIDELVNAAAGYHEPLAIVLDDLHVLKSDDCLRSIEYAVEHLPQTARLVATTRADPPIGLARLRGKGMLGEIRGRDLAFTFGEARQLLVEREEIALDDDDVRLLVDRTEGWPAGLYLAALWLRTLADPKTGVRDFHGDHRHVADYLTGEVLETLDAETHDFLVRTSVLERFTAAMCDAVLGRADSTETISELERSNLFVVPLDARAEWYRYHHLFRELLQLELTHSDPSAAPALHRRAFEWCRAEGLVGDALVHAAAAHDEEALASLLVEQHRPMLMSGRHLTFLNWVDRLPDELLLEHSVLPVAAEIAARLGGPPAVERRRYLALAERARSERPDDWSADNDVVLGMASTGWIQNGVAEAQRLAVRTAELARSSVEVYAVPAIAGVALTSFIAGDLAESRRLALEALDGPDSPARIHGLVYALALLALVDAETGNVADAERHAEEALQEAAHAGISATSTAGFAHLALAVALDASDRTREAEQEAVKAEHLRRVSEPELTHAYVLLVLAGIRTRRGNLTAAEMDLRHARRILQAFDDAGGLPEFAITIEQALERTRVETVALPEPPTEAELRVLRLLETDLSQREIGARLYLSLNTVKTHTRSLYVKLGVTSRGEAVARAATLGFLDPSESPG